MSLILLGPVFLPPDEGIASILHVAAFVAVLALAFLRLDHVNTSSEDLKTVLEGVREKARDSLLTAGYSPSADAKGRDVVDLREEVKFGRVKLYSPLCALCVLADIHANVQLFWGMVYVIRRQGRLPFFVFYRSNMHTLLVLLSAAISVPTLFLFGFGAVREWEWIHDRTVQSGILVALAIATLIVVIMSFGSGWQNPGRLMKTCEALHKLFVQRWDEHALKSQEEARKYTVNGGVTPPHDSSSPSA